MKRDKDLIRELMLQLEQFNVVLPGYEYIYPGQFQIEGYDDQQILYHLRLIADAGYIAIKRSSQPVDGYLFQGLTNAGHDFVDAVRDPEIWGKTKHAATQAGGFSLDLLRDLAKGLIRKKIAEHTGIEI